MGDFDKIKLLHKSYRLNDFKPKNLFSSNSSKQDNIILLSFYITTMSLEILKAVVRLVDAQDRPM